MMGTRLTERIAGFLAVLTACAALASSPEPPEPDEYDDLVRVRVVSEHPDITPGGTVWLGVRFEIEDGWYVYWPGRNDTGSGSEIKPAGPPNVRYGGVQWPAPTRQVAPGDIVNHVYKTAVTALIPVTAPADAEVGSELELSFDAAWLVCQDVCVPGFETVSITLPVVQEASPPDPRVAGLFAESRARIPKPQPDRERVATVEWTDQHAVLRARGAFRMAFYPDADCTPILNLSTAGAGESDSLRLRMPDKERRLSGVVELFSRDGISRVYLIRSTPDAPNG